MDILSVVDNLNEDMYLRFKSAAETGKWPEGTEVDKPQREMAMQIVMAYQSRVLKSKDMLTVGEDGQIVNKTKRELKEEFNDPNNIARFSDI
ncbi:YeaC family protein [Thalassotalea euphylliae]|uniref:YeaC family protein n=1 Tax=Thalassotalea euphylliae TaxID=1655234 RepID=UPI00363DA11F